MLLTCSLRRFFGVGFSLLAACDAHHTDPPVSLRILAPETEAVLPAGDVPVSLLVENFELVAPEQTAHRFAPPWPIRWVPEAQAHDEEGLPSGYITLSLNDIPVADFDQTQYTLSGVTAGVYTLTAELRYADGDPLVPAVRAEVLFTAE